MTRLIVFAGLAVLALLILLVLGRVSAGEAMLLVLIVGAISMLVPIKQAQDTRLSARTRRTDEEDELVRAVTGALVTPSFVLDWKANIIHRNLSASGILPRAEIGTPISFAIRHPAFQEAIETVRQTRLPEQTEFQQIGQNSQWFRVSVAPIAIGLDTAYPRDLLLVVLENQTEQRQVETMRADFVANASHELRTPLASVIGFIDTLAGPAANDPEARERFLGIMRNQSERMARLIDDLLSLSRIELRQHLKPEGEVNLTALLTELCETMQSQLKEASLVLDFDAKEVGAVSVGDRDELYQVFQNLLDNAIKYGSAGKRIELKLASARFGNVSGHNISVTDFGAGVPAEDLPRLTERFYRVDVEASRRKKGTGLGLAIAKHIVQRHRGELTIKSELGIGTSVRVFLPSSPSVEQNQSE